ncbi:MAG TPA: hypothetical protein VGY77_07415, partial [Gemmataceae bacterium]|nr:hypothetical protein [Gemmataceae bacterium]
MCWARQPGNKLPYNELSSSESFNPQVLIQHPKIKKHADPAVQHTEWPEIAILKIQGNDQQLKEKGAGREPNVIPMDRTKKNRAKYDEKWFVPGEGGNPFQVVDHDAQGQKLLNQLPDRIEMKKQQRESIRRFSDQDARQKYQQTADYYLKNCRDQRGVHEAMADPGD